MNSKILQNVIQDNSGTGVTPKAVKRELERLLASNREELIFHMPYEQEKKLLLMIKNGDTSGITAAMSKMTDADEISVGQMSEDAIKQSLCLLVSGITLFTRFAIDGGLNQELAYCLSDAYIKTGSKSANTTEIMQLFAFAAMDFAKRVRLSKGVCTYDVKKCTAYIQNHLHEKITLLDLADLCKISESYLSAQFKSQLGMPPLKYIISQKLELSCELLRFDNMPISEIAMLLGFCSSSNFAAHFKRKYAITPNKFRISG
ncbi:MAG: AraC family transcriptional regulator [Oscillospiraceae bacterium]